MSCSHTERVIELIDHAPHDALLERHVQGCAECSAELSLLRESVALLAPFAVPAPEPVVLERARRAVPEFSGWFAGSLGLASAAAMLLLIGLEPTIASQYAALTSVPLLLLAYGLGIDCARHGKLSPSFLGTSALGFALSLVAAPRQGTSAEVCATFGALVAVGPLAFSLLALRDLHPKRGMQVGAIAGAAAGALGVMVERLHCPLGNLQHALLGHAVILPAAIFMGALLGAAVLRPIRVEARKQP
jgi:hypothetical protein